MRAQLGGRLLPQAPTRQRLSVLPFHGQHAGKVVVRFA
jgi:hypothetical protein